MRRPTFPTTPILFGGGGPSAGFRLGSGSPRLHRKDHQPLLRNRRQDPLVGHARGNQPRRREHPVATSPKPRPTHGTCRPHPPRTTASRPRRTPAVESCSTADEATTCPLSAGFSPPDSTSNSRTKSFTETAHRRSIRRESRRCERPATAIRKLSNLLARFQVEQRQVRLRSTSVPAANRQRPLSVRCHGGRPSRRPRRSHTSAVRSPRPKPPVAAWSWSPRFLHPRDNRTEVGVESCRPDLKRNSSLVTSKTLATSPCTTANDWPSWLMSNPGGGHSHEPCGPQLTLARRQRRPRRDSASNSRPTGRATRASRNRSPRWSRRTRSWLGPTNCTADTRLALAASNTSSCRPVNTFHSLRPGAVAEAVTRSRPSGESDNALGGDSYRSTAESRAHFAHPRPARTSRPVSPPLGHPRTCRTTSPLRTTARDARHRSRTRSRHRPTPPRSPCRHRTRRPIPARWPARDADQNRLPRFGVQPCHGGNALPRIRAGRNEPACIR